MKILSHLLILYQTAFKIILFFCFFFLFSTLEILAIATAIPAISALIKEKIIQNLFRYFKTCLVLLLICSFYCCKKKSIELPYLSEEEMVNLFVELHLVDNILDVQKYKRNNFTLYKTYYNSTFEKYSLSQEKFDSCLTFFAHHPRVYEKIYVSVVDSLTKLKKEVDNLSFTEERQQVETSIIWRYSGKRHWSGVGNKRFSFKVQLRGKGTYKLNAKLRLTKDDLSINPMMKVYFLSPELGENVESLEKKIALKKDNNFRSYELSIILSDLRFSYIEGFVFTAENESEFYQDIEILEAKLVYLSKF